MLGAADIPAQLPGLIESGLAAGGIGLPPITGLAEAYEESFGTNPSGDSALSYTATSSSWQDNFNADVVANSLAVAVLAGLVLSLGAILWSSAAEVRTGAVNRALRAEAAPPPTGKRGRKAPALPVPWLLNRPGWWVTLAVALTSVLIAATLIFAEDGLNLGSGSAILITGLLLGASGIIWQAGREPGTVRVNIPRWVFPLVVVAGLLVAGYMMYIEVGHNEASCGAVGDCQSVQQSTYATLFGVLPVGVLGAVGYLAILGAWAVSTYSKNEDLVLFADLGLLGMATFGVVFSSYLTFLEPFVIGASCAWCLTSAMVMMLLLWLHGTARCGGPGRSVGTGRGTGPTRKRHA
ncbi:MAG: vitamin K epoxide reductase family protein [Anaerolineae bacterium]|nr:vitamin K epoxide reductase family protein [Anaerolineae bacterium]